MEHTREDRDRATRAKEVAGKAEAKRKANEDACSAAQEEARVKAAEEKALAEEK